MQPVSFAVVGVRNFAWQHIRRIRELEKTGEARLAAVVIADREKNREIEQALRSEGLTIFESFRQLLEEGRGLVDIITLPTSIPSHYPLAAQAMRAGFNVVMEKPPVPTVQQADNLRRIEKETGQFCSVGFQFIHARSIRRLKEVILDGTLGSITGMACKGYWSRDVAYYNRNPWAGKNILAGQLVLDGPMHNALAHFLNNMLFLSGQDMDSSASLASVRAELYRSRGFITGDDTSCLEAVTDNGITIHFYVTHSPKNDQEPYMEIQGSRGTAVWHFNEHVVVEAGGETMEFDNEGIDPWVEVMRTAARVHCGDLDKPYCTLENTRSFVAAINGAYQSARQILPIPDEYVRERGQGDAAAVEVKDIDEQMDEAFAKRKLLSDIGVPWAVGSRVFNLEGYDTFDPFAPWEADRL